jgi:hypothetical protein
MSGMGAFSGLSDATMTLRPVLKLIESLSNKDYAECRGLSINFSRNFLMELWQEKSTLAHTNTNPDSVKAAIFLRSSAQKLQQPVLSTPYRSM